MMVPGRQLVLASLCASMFSGCATVMRLDVGNASPSRAPTTMNNGATPGPAPGAAAVPSGPLRPFAEIVKDAKVLPGYFNVWQKDEKVWLEIDPDQLNEPFFMTVNLSRGLGERMLFAGLMGGEYGVGGYYLAEMRRVGNTLQLIARNTQFTATPGSPEERAVRNAFSDSLLSAAPVVSLPHPERKSILVDANALLLADIPRGSHVIERAYRNVYAFDRANSYFADVKSNEDRTTLDVTAHFTQARIPLAPPQGGPFFAPPDVIEDPRSLFLGFLYTFTKLPDEPMRPRLADARIGHFVMSKVDFSNERKASPRTYYVERWRLEKKDLKAAMSEPIKPITFWLDREIPVKYRAPITAGILEWNKAFERIGFKNAIEVKQQPDDADFDTGDALHASIRWMTTATPSFGAIGPSHVDPRTGEILDADIGWDANMTRNLRIFRAEVANNNGGGNAIGYTPMYDERTGELRAGKSQAATNGRACAHFEYAERELGFALAMLEARGELDPESPQAERFVAEYLKDVTMHEVGHALGLRHNFRASTVYTAEQLDDPDFTAKNGISGSVMEYSPINLGLRKGKQGQYFSSTLGPYDYWAIEYAYKPIAPEREAEELATIAARADQPALAFATDGDVYDGLDPLVNQNDLGADPLAYYRKRVQLSRELWQDLETRRLRPGESYEVLRRRFMTGFSQVAMAMGLTAKYVAGVTTYNDKAGSSRPPVVPVSAARQREAIGLLADALFRADSFRVPPQFLNKLIYDRLDVEAGGAPRADLPVADMVLNVQRDVLNRLMSPTVAQRTLNNLFKIGNAKEAMTLGELYGTLQSAIWSEARQGLESDVLRRNLQREHLSRVAAALLGRSGIMPADARALLRANARELRDQLGVAAKRRNLSVETRAHYAESFETLDEALKAPLERASP